MGRMAMGSVVALVLGFVGVALGSGCSSPPATRSDGPTAKTSAAIFYGHTDMNSPAANAVIYIQGDGQCSGFLLTSTMGITAAHCNPTPGDWVDIGINDPGADQPDPSRAARRIVAGPPPVVYPGWKPGSLGLRSSATDVALFHIWPPVTSDAAPQRPTLTPPPLVNCLDGSSTLSGAFEGYKVGCTQIDGGISGYGNASVTFSGQGLNIEVHFHDPQQRQVAYFDKLELEHAGYGDGLGTWFRYSHDDGSDGAFPHEGDSGGPLFRLPDPSAKDIRDVVGIASEIDPVGNICQLGVCDQSIQFQWADITAPTMKAWIVQHVHADADGKWDGELDYLRTAFPPVGCIAGDPKCDTGCNGSDIDCDFVGPDRDNCPDDYNPDQTDTDGDTAGGDACDLCPDLPSYAGADCNRNAEILLYGHDRVHLKEHDVVGPPLNPYTRLNAPVVNDNRYEFAGDQCDFAPCTQTATESMTVPSGLVTEQPLCHLSPKLGGYTCWFTSNARVQRDGRNDVIYDGVTGDTGYRYCDCLESDPLKCLTGGSPACPWQAKDFNSAGVHDLTTVAPAFEALANNEVGTKGDVFTDTAKPNPKTFDWHWWKDYNAIEGTSVGFPIPLADTGTVKLNGLIWSNVREYAPGLGDKDLSSYWAWVDLAFSEWVGVPPPHYVATIPAQWAHPGCPDCPWGFHLPDLIGPDPAYFTDRLYAGLPGGIVDITSQTDPYVAGLFAAAETNPDLVLVPASENGAYLDTLGGRLPMLGALDTTNLSAEGFITQESSGQLTDYAISLGGGRGALPLHQPEISPCLAALGTTSAPADVSATLSASQSALYLFTGSPDVPSAILEDNILTDACTRIVGPRVIGGSTIRGSTGLDPLGRPLAITYDPFDHSLYAVDRTNQPVPVRLLRVRLDGTVQVMAKVAAPWAVKPYLAMGDGGELVIASNHKQSNHYRVMILDMSGDKPGAVARYTGHGSLAAAPMFDQRGLYLALDGGPGQYPVFVHMAPGDLEHPKSSPLEWVFK